MRSRKGVRGERRRRRRLVVAPALAAALTVALLTGVAASPGPVGELAEAAGPHAAPAPSENAPFRDVILRGHSPRANESAARFEAYPDGDGHTVRVDRGLYSDADARAVVGQLGGLLHGAEMDRLLVSMLTDAEMIRICGAGALACYDPRTEEMFISGTDSAERPSRAFIVAHEYGHHVAANRSNSPWRALDWGTKRWATVERVCPGVARGAYKPGAYGFRSYYDNPGEAFAEAYAFYHFPDHVRWDWRLPEPDQRSYAAIEADVLDPWRRKQRTVIEGSLSGAGRDGRRLRVPLDGRLRLRLRSASGSDFEMRLLNAAHRRVLARTPRRRGGDSLRYEVCGKRRLYVQVLSRGGSGPYEVRVARP